MTKLYNRTDQKELRKKLRQQPIQAERLMWNELRNKRLGYKFRRQYGAGNYIMDFYSPELRLAIEIDGATHGEENEIQNDTERQNYLEGLGIKVIRFTNTQVRENMPFVKNEILEVCKELDKGM